MCFFKIIFQFYNGDVTKQCDSRVVGADFVSCIELIEHINPEDHPGLIKTIFGQIQPKTAVITTPNGMSHPYVLQSPPLFENEPKNSIEQKNLA